MARVWFSLSMRTPSLASRAWCRPSLYRRPGIKPAGEFIDNDDLALFDDIVHISFEQGMGLEGLVDMMNHQHVAGIIEVFDL